MTVRLITGIPGSGKTLFAVSELKKEIEKNATADEPRAIYCDITGLKIHDIPPPPIDWRDTPPRSLLIYDEAQLHQEFKPSRGQSPYKFVEELTIHRKTGHEIWFITQDPKRLHNDILAMCEFHDHLERPYGAKLASIYHYRGAEKNPSAKTVKERAENKTLFNYDKSLFELYESSQVKDGIKFRIPKEILFWLGVLALCLVATYYLVFNDNTQDFAKNVSDAKEMAQGDTPSEQTNADEQTAELADPTPIGQGEPIQQAVLQHLTKDELIEYVKTREKHAKNELEKYKLQVEQERLAILMQYDTLQKQLLEHDKQIKDFYARLELYKRHLPKNYDIIQQDPNLQVRAVVRKGNKCNAYNAHGNLMTLSMDECTYYIQEAGRLHRGNGQTTDIKADPVPKILNDNPNFGQGVEQAQAKQNTDNASTTNVQTKQDL